MARIGWLLVLMMAAGAAQGATVDEAIQAAASGDAAAVQAFLDGGGVVNAADAQGATLLHHAVAAGSRPVVGLLLARKADANLRKGDGVTPLHVAASLGRLEIARLLLAAGARPDALDAKGRTPISLARAARNQPLVALLSGRGGATPVGTTPAAPAGQSTGVQPAAAPPAAGGTPPAASLAPGTVQPTEEEARALKLMNADRTAKGLTALLPDGRLTAVARAHAADMVARGYFDHDNPDGKSPFDRMEAKGLKFTAAGENIALNSSVEGAQKAWMKSPGHRSNILSKDFTHVGIGCARDKRGRLFAVQLFARY